VATPTITLNSSTIGSCFTSEYGTVKFQWTITNPDGYKIDKIEIVRTADGSNTYFTSPKTTNLDENYLKTGFESPFTGEWTDTGLAIPPSITNETFSYVFKIIWDDQTLPDGTVITGGGGNYSASAVPATIAQCLSDCDEATDWNQCDSPDELELLLKFNTGKSPYVYDESSNHNHGKLRGKASLDPYGPIASTGPYSGTLPSGAAALKLNGGNDYVTIPSHPSLDLGTGAFSIDFWINLNVAQAASTGWQTIFQSANFRETKSGVRLTLSTNVSQKYFKLELGESTNPSIISGTSATSEYDFDLTTPIESKTWTHVATTRAADGYVRMFVNGVQIGSAQQHTDSRTEATGGIINISNGDDGFEIGSSKSGYDSFNGYMDHFRIRSSIPWAIPADDDDDDCSECGTLALPTDDDIILPNYFNKTCTDLCGDLCWDSEESRLSIWMDGYFENPLTGKASFDLKYCLNDKCAFGIADASIYFNLPSDASIVDFNSNPILNSSDCTFSEASDNGKYPDRWKLEVAHMGDVDYYKEENPVGIDCSNITHLIKFNQEPIINGTQRIIKNHANPNSLTTGDVFFVPPTASNPIIERDVVNKKFGDSSLKINHDPANTGGFISVNEWTSGSGELNWGTGEFTVDFWINFADDSDQLDAQGSAAPISILSPGENTAKHFELLLSITSGSPMGGTILSVQNFRLTLSDGTTTTQHMWTVGEKVLAGNWHHIALVRQNSNIGFWIDGQEMTATVASSFTASSTVSVSNGGKITIGKKDGVGILTPNITDTVSFVGAIDEFRITKGEDLWIPGTMWQMAFNFTPAQGTLSCFDIENTRLLPPSHGTFGTVYIDKPLGEGRVCFDTGNTRLEVVHMSSSTHAAPAATSTTYDYSGNLAKDRNAGGVPKWQTGPCLSTCTDEVEMGYGDYYFKPKPFDNNTVDVEYCLTRDNIDTFVIACITTDFKTGISAVDREFGDAIDHGWEVKVKNICPGFSIIYGHGEEVISNSGYSTLLRLYLDNNVIQKHHSDPKAKVCMFPLFMKVGNLYDNIDEYISKLDSPQMKRLRDSKNAGGVLPNDYQTPEFYYNDGYGSVFSSSTNNIVDGWQDGSAFLADLHLIADKIDKRYKQMVHYLADAFEAVIESHSTDEDYTADDGTRNSAIETAHNFRILYSYWLSLLDSFPELKSQFDFFAKNLHVTENDYWLDPKKACTYNGIDFGFRCDGASGARRIYIDILYNFPLNSISGVEIDLSLLKSHGVPSHDWLSSILEAESWGGDARNNNYIQAFSKNTGKYICVYGGDISSEKVGPQKSYLRTDITQLHTPVLTTIAIDATHSRFDNFFAEDDCLDPLGYKNFSENGFYWILYSSLVSSVFESELTGAVGAGRAITNTKFVSNERTTDIIHSEGLPKWSGNSYKADVDDSIDIRDLLTTTMLVVEPNGSAGTTTVDLSETNIESVVKLPLAAKNTSGQYRTVKDYYNLKSLDLTGIKYSTITNTSTNDFAFRDKLTGEQVWPGIDVNNSGKIDITDVVALRNVWTALGEYPVTVDQVTDSKLTIVPNRTCTLYDFEADILTADSCSTFCIKDPDCFSKLWISDMIVLRDEEGNPDNYLFEVSYSLDYSVETVITESLTRTDTIEDFSGVQFKVEGLTGVGIAGTENGTGEIDQVDATSIKAKSWDERILSSDTVTNDMYFSFSSNAEYISKGKGVLTYLKVSPDSLPDQDEWIKKRLKDGYTKTNKILKVDSNPMLGFLEEEAGQGVSYPMANIRFKSHHTDELMIYEKFGVRICDPKISYNRSYDSSDMSLLPMGDTLIMPQTTVYTGAPLLYHYDTNYQTNSGSSNNPSPTIGTIGTGTPTIDISENHFGAGSLSTDGTSGIHIPDTAGATDLGWDGSTPGSSEDFTIDWWMNLDDAGNAAAGHPGTDYFLIGSGDPVVIGANSFGQWFFSLRKVDYGAPGVPSVEMDRFVWKHSMATWSPSSGTTAYGIHSDGTIKHVNIVHATWKLAPKEPGSTETFDDLSTTDEYNAFYNNWHHFALEKKGGHLHIYMNGRRIGVEDISGYIAQNGGVNYKGFDAGGIAIGHLPATTTTFGSASASSLFGNPTEAWFDELRITKGTAVYAAIDAANSTSLGDGVISAGTNAETVFTPESAAYGGAVELTNFTGDANVDGNITNLDLDYALNLAATNGYEVRFDANQDGKIDILDVQAINHIVNASRFSAVENTSESKWENSAPSLACPQPDLPAPLLTAFDYSAAVGTTLDVVRGANTRNIDIVADATTNQLGCFSNFNYTGGVILYWEAVTGADYYTVYRQSPDEEAVQIIASAPGNAGNLNSFAPRPVGGVKEPIEIMPTMWIDFPPVLKNKCEAPAAEETKAEDFKYWVEAVRRCETSKSVERTKGVVNCRRLPTSNNINFVIEQDQQYDGTFDVSHPFAIPPIGAAAVSGSFANYPVWVYSQNSGDGNIGTSDKGGRIATKGSRPSNAGAAGSNELGFSYKPKKGFVGKDTFRYTATVLDPDLVNEPAMWCKDDGIVTVHVLAKNPNVHANISNCPDAKITLKWDKVLGATSYKVYEYEYDNNISAYVYVLKETILAVANKNSYESAAIIPHDWASFISTCAETGTEEPTRKETYKVTAITKQNNLELEGVGSIIDVWIPCCADITNPTLTITQSGYCDNTGAGNPTGKVAITWPDVSGYDAYNVYRRGPFPANGNMTDDWELIGDSYEASSGTTLTHEFIDNPDGCVGCDSIWYDYFVRSVDETGREGDEPASQATAYNPTQIYCCNTAPVARNQEDETDFEKTKTGLKLLADDSNNDIVSYSASISSGSGTIENFDSSTGTFDLKPDNKYYGDVVVDWTATDSCSNTSNTGQFTITVLPPSDCIDYDYIICNSKLEFVTTQQDTYGIRKKIATLTQVPFMLNSKGAPSLRKRCGAYTVTRGLNPSVLALVDDDNC